VLHDPVALADPVLFRRQSVVSLSPALAGTTALDLTQGAFGLALELRLSEETEIALVRPRNPMGERRPVKALLFTPTRPGALLDEAAARRLSAR
jgi:hypothetical protein